MRSQSIYTFAKAADEGTGAVDVAAVRKDGVQSVYAGDPTTMHFVSGANVVLAALVEVLFRGPYFGSVV